MSEAKPIELVTGHRTKEEIENRKEQQEKIRGDSSKIEPTENLDPEQSEIFYSVKDELKSSGILSNVDSYWLTKLAIAESTLREINKKKAAKPSIIFNKDFKATEKHYFDIFAKCCSEIGLSPIGRAKLANINSLAQAEKEDPLLKALKG